VSDIPTSAQGPAPGIDRAIDRGIDPIGRALDGLAALGRAVLGLCRGAGSIALFAAEALSHLVRPPFYGRLLWRAFLEISYFSLPVVALTAVFTGMVLALQSYTGFARFNAEGAVANVVVLSITRELGPVLAGLMVAGRIGAGFAAEIGTMRVTDQIDALTTLSTNPMKYLVAPRLLAGALALPLLVVVADVLGVMGGWLIGTFKLGFGSAAYLKASFDFLQTWDVVSGLVKAAAFGFIVALMGCWCGYSSKGGAQGVGAATTNAVVSSSILILAFDYILTEMFFAR
jgi:phospholipid/cholesterol/gamma-HCH transport system permease protein